MVGIRLAKENEQHITMAQLVLQSLNPVLARHQIL